MSNATLRRLETLVGKLGHPYIDCLHNKSLNPQRHVIERLQESSFLFACITPGFFKSEWVRLELNIAKMKRIPVIALPVKSLIENKFGGKEIEYATRRLANGNFNRVKVNGDRFFLLAE